MQYSVDSTLAQQAEKLRQLVALKQIPYAASRALNDTAEAVKADIVAGLGQKFTLRNNWVRQGFRIERSTKTNLNARIFSRDAFMGLQEFGGTKTPRKNYIAIPTTLVRRTPKDMIKKADRPKQLGDKLVEAVINGKPCLVLRKPRTGASGNKLRIMYWLIPRAQIHERLRLNQDGKIVADKKFFGYLEGYLRQALLTAR